MKSRAYGVAVVCIVMLLLFMNENRLPSSLLDVISPGFFVAVILNGSLHDHIMRGYLFVALFVDCLLYSLVVLGGLKLFARRRILN
jgi:hypothetical protein